MYIIYAEEKIIMQSNYGRVIVIYIYEASYMYFFSYYYMIIANKFSHP